MRLKNFLLLAPWGLVAVTMLALYAIAPHTAKYIAKNSLSDILPWIVVAFPLLWLLLCRWFSFWGGYATFGMPAAFGGGFPDLPHATTYVLEHMSILGVAHKTVVYKLFHKNILPNLIVMPLTILVGMAFLWFARRIGAQPRVPRWWPVVAALLSFAAAMTHILVLDPLGY